MWAYIDFLLMHWPPVFEVFLEHYCRWFIYIYTYI